MKKKTSKQSRWILDDGIFAYLFYDPLRQRLIGLRAVDTFTLIIEEYNTTTLDVIRKCTQQDGEKYAFPFDQCLIMKKIGLSRFEHEWKIFLSTHTLLKWI